VNLGSACRQRWPLRAGRGLRGKVGFHEEAVRLYRTWFRERTKDPRFLQALENLYQRLKRNGVLTLSCHCAPKPCHAEIVAEWLVERGKKEGRAVRVKIGEEKP
jgi:hypothetical protein